MFQSNQGSIQIPRAAGQPSNLTQPSDLFAGKNHSCVCHIVKPIKMRDTIHNLTATAGSGELSETYSRASQAQRILRALDYNSEVVTLMAGNGHRLIHEKDTEVLMIDFTTD